jgi:hypothetical protein
LSTVVVGCVSQLFQGDLDLGRRAAAHLAAADLPAWVSVEDLHYGAIAVSQRLEDLSPRTLILVGAEEGGRPPGAVERRRVHPTARDPVEVQVAVDNAGTGYVSIGLIVEVADGFGVLPQRTVLIEVEPVRVAPTDELTPQAEEGLTRAVELVLIEVRRTPVLELAARIRELLADGHIGPNPARDALEALLGELDRLDREGHWGRTFAERDRLRLAIAEGATGVGMDHRDWGLWWGMIEELDRLERAEAG